VLCFQYNDTKFYKNNQTKFLAAHFVKRNTKNCGGEKRSGESEIPSPPPTPLPFCPPERKSFLLCRGAKHGNQISQSGFSSKKVRILTKQYRQFIPPQLFLKK